jgi:hypothetical protein
MTTDKPYAGDPEFADDGALIVNRTMQIEAAHNTWTYLGDASYALCLTPTFINTPLASHPVEGPVAIVTSVGLGCGGRGSV